MQEKLKEAKLYYESISDRLAQPETVKDRDKFLKLMAEYKRLAPVIEKSELLEKLNRSLKDAEYLCFNETDKELRELAEEEIRSITGEIEIAKAELEKLLTPPDKNDGKNVVMEIRAGAGGEEAALFASVLFRMYSMYIASLGYRLDIVSCNETGLGGFREISYIVEGVGAFSKLRFESGVHRVQRVPETESQGRIHTSTVTVAVLPEADEVDVEINPNDLKIDTIKSTGAGGQHINKTESAIRILHRPSGIVVECQDQRSQFKNRDKAMKILRSKLFEIKQSEQASSIAADRRSQVGTGDRSEKIRTYNYPQSRITDHRIGLSIHSFDSFLNGDIEEMITALATYQAAEKLKKSEE